MQKKIKQLGLKQTSGKTVDFIEERKEAEIGDTRYAYLDGKAHIVTVPFEKLLPDQIEAFCGHIEDKYR